MLSFLKKKKKNLILSHFPWGTTSSPKVAVCFSDVLLIIFGPSSMAQTNKQNQFQCWQALRWVEAICFYVSCKPCVFLQQVKVFFLLPPTLPVLFNSITVQSQPPASFTADQLSSDSSPHLPCCWSTFSPPLLPSLIVAKPSFYYSISGTIPPLCVTSFSSQGHCW